MAVRKAHVAEVAGDIMENHPQSDGRCAGEDGDGTSDGEGGSSRDAAGWSEEEGEGDEGVGGWADAMATILGKKSSKAGILVKSKELEKMKAAERREQQKRQKQVDEKRRWEMMFREKPDVSKDRDTEKALQRIATRGVVQLFNAVRKHQQSVDAAVKDAGSSERKKAKILSSFSKKDFVSVLRKEDRAAGRTRDHAVAAAEDQPSWSVLRDDFMMGASMKDWDRDSDGEEAGPDPGGRPDRPGSD